MLYFSPLGKLADRAIYFTSVTSYFLTSVKLSQNLLDRFSQSFNQMKGICVNFLDPNLFSDYLRDVAANRFWAKFAKWPLFNTLAFRNLFEYRNFDLQVLKGTILATFCAILVKISPLNPEIMHAGSLCISFATRRQKLTYHIKYLSKYWTELHQFFSILVGLRMRITKLKQFLR